MELQKPTAEQHSGGTSDEGKQAKFILVEPVEETENFADQLLHFAGQLAERLRVREAELDRLLRLAERVNRGVTLEQVLAFVYDEMRTIVPYNRISLALVDEKSEMVKSHWVRSDRELKLRGGFSSSLEGSTLLQILQTGQPRIINDLEAYLASKPSSYATRLIVEEGMRSSLTCPLVAEGKPIGFLFCSSTDRDAYSLSHIRVFRQIAGLLSSIIEKGCMYDELVEQKRRADEQNRQMHRQLSIARRVQKALIPAADLEVPGLQIAFLYEPVDQVGGDILDLVPTQDGRIVLIIGDAMGHGVQAALVMSAVKAAAQSAILRSSATGEILAELNSVLSKILNDQFVTAVCGVLEPCGRTAEFALAGHERPLLLRANAAELVPIGKPGLPLGIGQRAAYHTVRVTFTPGDLLLFFTDGLIEACNDQSTPYGAERLKSLLLRHRNVGAREMIAIICDDLRAHCQHRPLTDDLTILVVKARSCDNA